jgi:phage shock protein PspC (stress-responsive transcriptional regulator)
MTDQSQFQPPAPGPSAGPGYAGAAPADPPPLTAFAWRTGLVRPRQGRLIAGVCGALARATNTDPILWRILIAVLTIFGGFGALIYVLGWLLLPADGDTASPVESVLGRGHSATPTVLTIIVAVILVASFGIYASDPFRPGLVGAFLVAGAVVLLIWDRRNRGPAVAGPIPPPGVPRTDVPPNAPFVPGSPLVSGATVGSEPTQPTGAPMQPTWPAATTTAPPPAPPFAPHGPYAPPTPPAPPPPGAGWPARPPIPPAPRHREPSRLFPLTMSLVLVVVGLVGIFDLAGYSVPVAGYFAAALVAIGAGLILGAWVGRARGLIALGIIGAVLLSVSTVADFRHNDWRGGSMTWAPVSLTAVQDSYQQDFGDARLDLSQIDFTQAKEPVTVDVRVDVGNLVVILPSDVDVTVDASVDVGNAEVFRESWGGLNSGTRTVVDEGRDGPGGGKLILTAAVDLGNLEVHR